MPEHPDFMTRRRFLRNGLLGGAAASTIPGFLDTTLRHIEAAETGQLQRPHGKDAPIFVLIQLAGGNDGLNTIIPHKNDYYAAARPRLQAVSNNALKLDDEFSMHASLSGLKSLYDDGLLGIVHGVGYPNPNRSHFRSTEIWHTGLSDPRNVGADGWLGRFFDANCSGMSPEIGVSLSASPPQVFNGQNGLGITFRNPNQFKFNDEENEGASIDMMDGAPLQPADPLAFLERTHLNAHVASDHLHSVLKKSNSPTDFPASKLGRDLKLIAQLIGGGLSTRVFYGSQGGYDTHANQASTHARLLKEFGDGMLSFWKEMKKQGNAKRVCMLVFSEFGRRVRENGSAGTDHGAAAPVFMLGGNIKPGFHGTFPSLAPADLFRGDIQHTADFRGIYGEVLAKHLGVGAEAVLGEPFEQLGVM